MYKTKAYSRCLSAASPLVIYHNRAARSERYTMYRSKYFFAASAACSDVHQVRNELEQCHAVLPTRSSPATRSLAGMKIEVKGSNEKEQFHERE